MKAIENFEDFDRLKNQGKPILLDFYADWCGPCQALLPTVEKLAKEYEGRVEIQKVNVDKNKELAAYFEVRSIPSLFFMQHAKIVERITGLVAENTLREKLEVLVKQS